MSPARPRDSAVHGDARLFSGIRSAPWWRRPLVLGFALLVSDAFAQADSPPAQPALRVELRDAESREVLRGAACALVRRGSGEIYARFDAPAYRGARPVRVGDEILVYRRGYDLARVRLKDGRWNEGRGGVTVALAPASRPCVIVLREAGEEDPRFRLVWSVATAFGARDRYETEGRGRRTAVRVPRGVAVDVTVEGRGLVAWPRRAPVPADGSVVEVRVEKAWRPTLRVDVHDRVLRPTEVEFFPDLLFRPPGPAARVDAWRMAVHRPWWGRRRPLRSGAQALLAPPVPVHVVATIGGRTVVRRFAPGAAEIDLRRAPPPEPLAGWPVVDGARAVPGSYLLPGRLDTATVAAFLDIRGSHPGLVQRVPVDVDRAARPPSLPPSEWLTVWHPERGLAHLRRRRGEVPRGVRYPGTMAIHAPRGWRIEGAVAAFPVWRGTGLVRTVPPDAHLRRDCDGLAVVRYEGLRPGWHAFDMHFDLVHRRSGRRHRVDYTYEVELPAARPHRRFDLHDPDRARAADSCEPDEAGKGESGKGESGKGESGKGESGKGGR